MTYPDLLADIADRAQIHTRASAQTILEHVGIALETLGPTLAASQRKYLYRLRHTWKRRAMGHDPRWLAQGGAPGRPAKSKTTPKPGTNSAAGKAASSYRREESTYDDLSLRIIRKYSRIAAR